MSLSDLYEMIVQLNVRGQLPAFLIGVLVAVIVGLLAARWLRLVPSSGRDSEVARLDRLVEAATAERDLARDQLARADRERDVANARVGELAGLASAREREALALTAACEGLKDEGVALAEKYETLALEHRSVAQSEARLSKQLERIAESDGRMWEVARHPEAPEFRPLSLRRTPVIAVLNLKGGVGKTTLTANLGASMAEQGRRVLMVDLDHQGSLSELLLTYSELSDLRHSGRFVHRALAEADGRAALRDAMVRASGLPGEAHVVAADEALGDVEASLLERWRAGATDDDVRYRLRAALHAPDVASRFDVVLLDCPPRLTTACVNALAACDWVLIPVLPDPTSTAGVPRLLRWLQKIRPDSCPELSVLGVVGNKAKYYGPAPVIRQRQELEQVAGFCRDTWGEPVRFFTPMRMHSPTAHRLAALDPKYRTYYRDLVKELLEELPSYARRRSAGLPAKPDPAVGVLGG